MDYIKELTVPVIELGNKLGGFLIPTLVLASIALLLFAIFSFKLLKIVLPFAGAALGYVLGGQLLTPFLKDVFPGAGFFTTEMLAGIICGVVIGFICLKSYDLAVVIGGIAIGYVFLSELAIFGLRQLKFVRDVLLNTDMKTAVTIGIIISVLCGFITLCLFKKCFNITYILSTAVIATVLAFLIPAIFIFKDAESATKSILAAGDIGMCVGLLIGGIQYYVHRYD